MLDLAGSITDNGATPPDPWSGGLDERPSRVGLEDSAYASIDLTVTALCAYTVLGRPLAELEGACVALGDAVGAVGRELADRLRDAGSWDGRFDVVERFLLRRVSEGPAPTPSARPQQSHRRRRTPELGGAERGAS